MPSVKIRDIAERLQIDLINSPRQMPKRGRAGGELKFIQRVLGDFGYKLSRRKLETLAAKAKSYDVFLSSATK
jgi:hypothetical protein